MARSRLICEHRLDMAAETNGTHGVPTEHFQQQVLNLNNLFRQKFCANGLREDEALHAIAHRIAHDRANNKTTSLSNDYNEIEYSLDTDDPSKITRETLFFVDRFLLPFGSS